MTIDDNPLILRREFRHRVEHVFNAFKKSEAIAQWFAPHESIKTTVSRFEFYEGGVYRMEFSLPNGMSSSLTGTFQTINEPQHLVFSFCWEKPDPHADIKTVVTVDLIEKGVSTEIVVSHYKLRDEPMRDRHREGWQGTLSRLRNYLTEIEAQKVQGGMS